MTRPKSRETQRPEPVPVRLRSVKRDMVRPTGRRRPDGQITTVPAMSKKGDVATYNGNSPSIRLYAIHGELAPVDDQGKAWLATIKEIAVKAEQEVILI